MAEQPSTKSFVKCGGDHNRPAKAVARVVWPSGRYNPERACTGHLDYLVRVALDSEEQLLITPLAPWKPDRAKGHSDV